MLLTADGDTADTDHIFTGKSADVSGVGAVLDEIFAANKRLRTASSLATRFRDGAKLAVPLVRLNKQECRALADAFDDFAKDKPKTTKARKLRDHLCNALCVF